MSCGPECPGGSGSPGGGRMPSFMPNTRPQRQPAARNVPREYPSGTRPPSNPQPRPVRFSPQRQVCAVAPNMGAPVEQAPAFDRGAHLPRFPSPIRRGPRQVARVSALPPVRPPIDTTFRVPGRMPPVPLPPPVGSPIDTTFRIPGRLPPVPLPPPRGSPIDTTFRIPGRMPPVPLPAPVGSPIDTTFRIPGRMPPVPLPPQRTPQRQVPMDQTFRAPVRTPPAAGRTPCQRSAARSPPSMGIPAPPARQRSPVSSEESYEIPTRFPPPRRPPVIDTPSISYSSEETYDLPTRFPPSRQSPVVDSPTISYDNSEILAESVMDDMGGGDEWTVASAVSINNLPDESEEEEDEPSFENVVESSRNEEDFTQPCVPCESPASPESYFPNISNQPQLDDVGPEELYDSTDYLADISPPPYLNYSQDADDEDSSLGLLPQNLLELTEGSINVSQAQSIAEAPSNLSVYDAEELNRTTAPRNSDIDIPRNRIWQNLMNSLNESENDEDGEYAEFIERLQRERREFIQGSPA